MDEITFFIACVWDIIKKEFVKFMQCSTLYNLPILNTTLIIILYKSSLHKYFLNDITLQKKYKMKISSKLLQCWLIQFELITFWCPDNFNSFTIIHSREYMSRHFKYKTMFCIIIVDAVNIELSFSIFLKDEFRSCIMLLG